MGEAASAVREPEREQRRLPSGPHGTLSVSRASQVRTQGRSVKMSLWPALIKCQRPLLEHVDGL